MQNTNSSAFLQLRPTKTTDLGGIIEEHNRYERKYKSEKEARENAKKRYEQEQLAKRNKGAFTRYAGLSDIESDGYFREQIVKYKEDNANKWMELSKRAEDGDSDAIMKLSYEKDKLNSLINTSKVVSTKNKELLKSISDNGYNEYRDRELLDLVDSMSTSKYALDSELGKFRIYSKDGSSVVMEVDPKELQNRFIATNFNSPPEFSANAKLIAKDILDEKNKNKTITGDTKLRALKRIRLYFAENNNDAISWYAKEKLDGNIKSDKEYSELSPQEKLNLEESFYEKAVEPSIVEKRDALRGIQISNAIKTGRNKDQEFENGKSKEKEPSFKIVTDSSGNTDGLVKDRVSNYDVDENNKRSKPNDVVVALSKPIKSGDVTYDSFDIIGDRVVATGYTNAVWNEEKEEWEKSQKSEPVSTDSEREVGIVASKIKGVKNTKDFLNQVVKNRVGLSNSDLDNESKKRKLRDLLNQK